MVELEIKFDKLYNVNINDRLTLRRYFDLSSKEERHLIHFCICKLPERKNSKFNFKFKYYDYFKKICTIKLRGDDITIFLLTSKFLPF